MRILRQKIASAQNMIRNMKFLIQVFLIIIEYFDVTVTYAKQDSKDIFIKINIHNRKHESAGITVLPTLWFYNRFQQ